MRSKSLLSFCAALFVSAITFAENTNPLWMRYPAISPDGKTVAFCYKGDIYSVDSKGGKAYPLTNNDTYDFMPTWSPDGKWIAFASDRNGNYDVYLMPAEGGQAQRLTFNSSNDLPQCFSPDGKTIYFTATRVDNVKYTQFPAGNLNELYSVSVGGGRENMVLSIPVEGWKSNKAGDKFIFHDKKGGEDQWRKHHTSSITRDLWLYEKNGNKYTKLTTFEGEDRTPVYTPDEKEIYYLSEKSGSYNIWKMSLDNPASPTQITSYDKNPVRFLSLSNTNVLCFGFNGEIFTQPIGGAATKLEVSVMADEHLMEGKTEVFTTGATEMEVSPSGKELVFVIRGEVFVTSVENGTTKRITDTPGQERNASFSPDGRSILYASERNNIWGLYQTKLSRKDEKYFFNSTLMQEETILAGKGEAFQPHFSPDGKEVAFIEDRTAVKVINLASKAVRTIMPAEKNYSYSDGDQSFEWSPDGKYILVHFLQDDNWLTQVGLVDAEGKGPIVDLTQSGFGAGGGSWMCNGNVILYYSDRHGMKNVASHGRQSDAYGLFLNKAFYDRFKLSKEEHALLKEKEEKDKDAGKGKDKKADSLAKIKPIKIEFEGLQDRKVRLTMHSSHLGNAILSADGEKLYYLCKFEKGFDLWQTKFKEKETKILCKLEANGAGGMVMDKDGKNLFLVADGNLIKIEIEKGEKKGVAFNAEMNLNLYAEREYMFEHQWRQVKKKFYVTDLQKTDWDYYKTNYVKFLPHINNNRDFSEMMSELLGELNASHTGCFYRPKPKNGDETAQLGAFFDETYTGKGLKIVEVLEKGPLNVDGSQIKAGTIIEKIDGVEIEANTNYYKLLNRKVGKPVLLSLYDGSKRWEETVRPIHPGTLNNILYMRWIKRMQEMADKLSGGTVAYMHVAGMNDEAYREFYDQVMGKYNTKKALIVDTRFNGGGWLHDDLATFLSGKKYIDFVPRERRIGIEPGNKWTKPSCVLMSEGNYSDAHMFPVVYKTLGIGKLVGMPVPGTGTAVWWENLQDPSLVFGIPQVGVKSPDGKYYENTQQEPDVKVANEYNPMLEGKDQQLEEAVKLMMGAK
jgi:tricorn protease